MLANVSMSLALASVILLPVTRSIDKKNPFAASEERYRGLFLDASCSFFRLILMFAGLPVFVERVAHEHTRIPSLANLPV